MVPTRSVMNTASLIERRESLLPLLVDVAQAAANLAEFGEGRAAVWRERGVGHVARFLRQF